MSKNFYGRINLGNDIRTQISLAFMPLACSTGALLWHYILRARVLDMTVSSVAAFPETSRKRDRGSLRSMESVTEQFHQT